MRTIGHDTGGWAALLTALILATGVPSMASEPGSPQRSLRDDQVINGTWEFQPLRTQDGQVRDDGWGAIRVPGAWARLPDAPSLPGVERSGAGAAWSGLTASASDAAWNGIERACYRTTTIIPATWTDRSILLDIDRPSMAVTVAIDGRPAGTIRWPGGELDITDHARPGSAIQLDLLVDARSSGGDEIHYMGTAVGQMQRRSKRIPARGLLGDVRLTTRPRGARIDTVAVTTSVRQGMITLDLAFADVTTSGPVSVQADMLRPDGTIERQFETAPMLTAGPESALRVAWQWSDARRWDVGRPELYRAVIRVHGAGIDDRWEQPFGFREFRIDGRRFLLNEREIRLRPGSLGGHEDQAIGMIEQIDSTIAGLRRIGFNCQQFWPYDNLKPGTPAWHELWYERADQLGWPVLGALSGVSTLIGNVEPGARKAWEEQVTRQLRRIRNHPSVLMWGHSANCFGAWWDQDPRAVGDSVALAAPGDDAWRERQRLAEWSNGVVRRLDPSRPVYNHMSGPNSDVHATNTYLGLIPWQEQEEWLSRWAIHGDRPFMAVEFGPFPPCEFRRGRNGGGWEQGSGAVFSEDFTSEHLARYLGPAVYRDEPEAFRRWNADNLMDGQRYRLSNPPFGQHPSLNSWLTDGYRRIYRAWRAWGISGGMIPWEYRRWWPERPQQANAVVAMPPFKAGRRGLYWPQRRAAQLDWLGESTHDTTPPGRALQEALQPTLAWIAAPVDPVDPGSFLAGQRAFQAGSHLRRTILVLNDSGETKQYHGRWQISVNGAVMAHGSLDGEIATAARADLPVSAALPPCERDLQGEVVMDLTIAGTDHHDRFAFTVLPPEPGIMAIQGRVLADPSGGTSRMLDHAGIELNPSPAIESPSLLVVGRRALSDGAIDPGRIEHLARSGSTILVMGQDPEWLRKQAGFRIGHWVMRQAWPAAGPDGLDITAGDLRGWAGESALVDPRPFVTRDDLGSFGYPRHGWRWGARGGVCSAPIEIPHTPGWRPLVICDFDLAYAAVLVQRLGRGTVVWCTLDLEDHAEDPSARRVARRLLERISRGGLLEMPRTIDYVGGARGTRLLGSLGITAPPSAITGASLLLIGDGPADEAAIENAVRGGATAFVLPGEGTGPCGLGRSLDKANIGSLDIPGWPECSGIGPGWLRRRGPAPAWVLDGGNGWETAANGLLARKRIGNGQMLACQLDPDAIDADRLTYLRLTRWRVQQALAQLLTNLGAPTDSGRLLAGSGILPLPLAGDWAVRATALLSPARDAASAWTDSGLSTAAREALHLATGGDLRDWQTVPVPGQQIGVGNDWSVYDGEAVYARAIVVPADWKGKDLLIALGVCDDFDTVWFNGQQVGHTGIETPGWWMPSRRYTIPSSLVRPGIANQMVIRLFDRFGGGGLRGPASELWLAPKELLRGSALYHPDYRDDFNFGDDPHRYCRW